MSNIKSVRNRNIKNDTYINLRCNRIDKQKILKKAELSNKSISEYVLDSAIAGTERKSNKDHRRIMNLVERTGYIKQINDLINQSKNRDSVIVPVVLLEKLLEKENELWDI